MSEKWKAIPSKTSEMQDCYDIMRSLGGSHYEYIGECRDESFARLIAAAPDLLEAAKEAVKLLQKGKPGWGVSKDILRLAIAKAEGK